MTNDQIDETVLRVLSGQHPDYLIHPEATAFVVEGLDGDSVSASLQRLEAAGYARLDEVVAMEYKRTQVFEADGVTPAKDADGNDVWVVDATELVPAKNPDGSSIVVAEGWACTDSGHANAIKHAPAPNPERLAGALVQAITQASSFDEAKQSLAAIETELSS